ncbi:MAG TPA: rhomboid family intramembrane serine protease [Verrucomicrobiae bacterium]|nr:rhomboid family intramembrane serine protease [Verrucomicrobiae bacterium]
MRSIGHIRGEKNARTFSNYLYVSGIRNDIEADRGEAWIVWVHDEDQVEAATARKAEFLAAPDNPKFGAQARQADGLREKERQTEVAYQKRVRDARQLFPPGLQGGYGYATFFFAAISVAVFLLSKFAEDMTPVSGLYISSFVFDGPWWERYKGMVEVGQGQIWRIFTPMFLHFSFLHIFFNLIWLLDLGSMIERRDGTLKTILLILVISGVSNVAQYIHVGPDFGGMSGVTYGLFGYIWIRAKYDPGCGLWLHPTTVTMMLIWFAVCFTGFVGHIANTVHAAGLLVGMAWGWIDAMRR